MSVSSVRSRDFRAEDYTKDEVDAMKADASSANAMNKVRRDAGLKGSEVTMRGDDRSNAELRKDWEAHELEEAGVGTVADMVIEGLEGTILHALAPLKFAVEGGKALNEAKEHGEALAANNERGAMHLAMLSAIDVPQGYKNVEIDRWKEAGTGNTSGATKMATALATSDKKEAALLQLHADRGMNAARGLIDARLITRDGDANEVRRALSNDPALKAKYDSDPAFRSGFDALVWAKQHDTGAYQEAVGRLEARDARYSQHAISFRG